MLAMLRCGAMSEVLSTAMRPAPRTRYATPACALAGIGAGLPDTVEFFAKQNARCAKFERELELQ